MSAPLVKGLIIGTSILLAAGLAIYESEQFQAWFEAQRRRMVVVLDNLANSGATVEQQTRRAQEMETELREEVVRRHRMDIINRAREEGVAVDLDELEAVESIYDAQQALLDEAATNKQQRDGKSGLSRRDTARSFDELVGHDGRLREEAASAAKTTSASTDEPSGLRHRSAGGSGFARGAAFAGNPFDDESHGLFDQELIGAGGGELADLTRTSILSSAPEKRDSKLVHIDVEDGSAQDEAKSPYKTDTELDAEIQEAIKRSLDEVTVSDLQKPLIVVDDHPLSQSEMFQMPLSASSSSLLDISNAEQVVRAESPSMQGSIYESYYYGAPQHTRTSPAPQNSAASVSSFHSAITEQLNSLQSTPQHQYQYIDVEAEADNDWNSDDALTPAGTLTPTEDAFSMADDLSVAGDVSPIHSPRSRTLSIAGSVAISEEFSDVGDGVMTPASWTDVDSVSGEEEANNSAGQSGVRRIIVR